MKSLSAMFNGRSEREQQILAAGILVGIPLLVYLLIWQPLLDGRRAAAERLEQRQQSYIWMQNAAAQIRAAQGNGQRLAFTGSPQQQITSAARQYSINISRIEPQSGGRYSVWVARCDYNNAVQFIDALLASGIALQSLSMNLLDVPGNVSLRLSLGGEV
ncbi:MAG: type II secretion system protein GspM [Spongiibacter sp.]